MKPLLALALLITLPSCAYVVEGKTQDIYVETQPECAQCILTQEGKVVQRVACTPEMVKVNRTIHDIEMQCTKAGYAPKSAMLKSGTEDWVWGNILWGPVAPLTLAIDMTTGAVNEYEQVGASQLPMMAQPAPVAAPSMPQQVPFATGESEYIKRPEQY